ncbi:MAG: helix-turn-helix domain-containing protein, partial [Actinomycetota bacterium]|nr:helix-turn-helix domain-containing protein [Actinomycetota bacterium]
TFVALREQLEAYRSWVDRLGQVPEADQEDVDALFGLRRRPSRRTTATRSLPPTMARVLDIIRDAPHPLSAADVAALLGASRPTAQRYLAALVQRQLLDLDLTYGTTGRPEHRYAARRRTSR